MVRKMTLVLAAGWLHATVPAPAPAAPPAMELVRTLPADSGAIDVATGIAPAPGGAVITGWTRTEHGGADALVIRIDREGEVVWRRTLGGSGPDILFAIQGDDAGGFVCAGFTGDTPAGEDRQGWVVRLAATGDVTWQRTFGGPGEDRLVSLQPTADGWLAGGQTRRGDDVDAWVLRLDRDGEQQASWVWGGKGTQRGLGLAATADGGCVVVGGMGERREESDGFVTRLGPDGRARWTRRVSGPGMQVAYHVRALADPRAGAGESFLVTGYGFQGEARDHDGYVLRLSAAGTVVRRTPLGGTSYDRATQSVPFDDGSTATVGYTKRPGAADDAPAWQTMLYGTDAGGRTSWTIPLGGEGVESGRWIERSGSDVWVVSQAATSPGTGGVLVARLRLAPAAPPETPGRRRS